MLKSALKGHFIEENFLVCFLFAPNKLKLENAFFEKKIIKCGKYAKNWSIQGALFGDIFCEVLDIFREVLDIFREVLDIFQGGTIEGQNTEI